MMGTTGWYTLNSEQVKNSEQEQPKGQSRGRREKTGKESRTNRISMQKGYHMQRLNSPGLAQPLHESTLRLTAMTGTLPQPRQMGRHLAALAQASSHTPTTKPAGPSVNNRKSRLPGLRKAQDRCSPPT